jgi:hypothetical protein
MLRSDQTLTGRFTIGAIWTAITDGDAITCLIGCRGRQETRRLRWQSKTSSPVHVPLTSFLVGTGCVIRRTGASTANNSSLFVLFVNKAIRLVTRGGGGDRPPGIRPKDESESGRNPKPFRLSPGPSGSFAGEKKRSERHGTLPTDGGEKTAEQELL